MKSIEIVFLPLEITFVPRISIFHWHIGRDSNNGLTLIIKFDEAVAPCHRNLHILLKTSTSEIKMKMRHVKEKKKNNGQNAHETMVILGDTKKLFCHGNFGWTLCIFFISPHSLVDEEICFFNYRVW